MTDVRIFVDLDGVLVDFISAALECHGATIARDDWPPAEWSVPKILGISKSEFWRKIDDLGHTFWADLQPYAWKDPLIAAVSSIDSRWTIATAPSMNPACPHGKILWMRKHLPKESNRDFMRFMIGRDKHALAGPSAILIDDSDEKINDFTAAGGIGILFPQPWNTRHDITDPLPHVISRLVQAVDCLRSQRR